MHVDKDLLTSIIITTYNRCDALIKTLHALGRQTVPSDQYEIIVVDNGSSDGTFERMRNLSLPCSLKVFRHSENKGISGGRNLGIPNAHGKYLIFLSDDVIVPEIFIAKHIETLEKFPRSWVTMGLTQVEDLKATPFGRYLDRLEQVFDEDRKAKQIDDNLWQMNFFTARNISLRKADLDSTGLFDEQFRNSCEDQDLALRAREVGIRFLYNTSIKCIHNDQMGDLKRYCNLQRRGAHDTVFFCSKYYEIHGRALITKQNGYISKQDTPGLIFTKAVKLFLSNTVCLFLIEKITVWLEKIHTPDSILWRIYRLLIGLYIFKGWREGLSALEKRQRSSHA